MEGIFFSASSADLAALRLDECGGLIDAGGVSFSLKLVLSYSWCRGDH